MEVVTECGGGVWWVGWGGGMRWGVCVEVVERIEMKTITIYLSQKRDKIAGLNCPSKILIDF